MKFDVLVDVSPFFHETVHSICGYQGKNLISNGKSDRVEKYLEFEEEQEEFLAGVDFRIKEILNIIPEITGKIIFVFDCIDTKCFRHDLYSDYKGKREKHRFAYNYSEFKNCIKKYKLFLEENGFITLESSTLEADDIIGELCKINHMNTIILSPDGDMKQLLDSSDKTTVVMFDSGKKKVITSENFKISNILGSGWVTSFGDEVSGIFDNDIQSDGINQFFKLIEKVNPKKSLLTKVISGDTSDNIPSCISYTRGTSTYGITKDRMEKFFESNNTMGKDILTWDFVENILLPELNNVLKTKKILEVFPEPKKFADSFDLNKKLIAIGEIPINDSKRELIKSVVDISTHKSTKRNFINIEMFGKIDKNWMD